MSHKGCIGILNLSSSYLRGVRVVDDERQKFWRPKYQADCARDGSAQSCRPTTLPPLPLNQPASYPRRIVDVGLVDVVSTRVAVTCTDLDVPKIGESAIRAQSQNLRTRLPKICLNLPLVEACEVWKTFLDF
ncbi:hypothetical protein QAD02_015308 [Eretmocerus hayati]|uniref:Uncharacterized protein n=1 Tax=Eretmocerus hayati TaxID=131215 RepID=A0ACC2P7V1_9HYME|nr:hypothetical protein QAD02_015308 [Eretmocerus hayati]